jgi:hypothetical protein
MDFIGWMEMGVVYATSVHDVGGLVAAWGEYV